MRTNSSSFVARKNVLALHTLRDHAQNMTTSAAAHQTRLHHRYGKDAIYEATLHRYLAGRSVREINFFANARRFDLMSSILGDRLAQRPLRILNAASGPFALEFYAALDGATIESFDIDDKLVALHKSLMVRNLIAPCTFRVMDVASFEPDETYDVVLVNDLFYAKNVDFFAVIEKFAAAVAPGGVLYFDIQDRRAGPIWRLLGKGNATQRYDLTEVRACLERLGFAIEAVKPALGIKGHGIDAIARRSLWRWFGVANNFAFAATR